jgi:hypothetical protein
MVLGKQEYGQVRLKMLHADILHQISKAINYMPPRKKKTIKVAQNIFLTLATSTTKFSLNYCVSSKVQSSTCLSLCKKI